jgi:isopenicillin-N epimerase
MPIPECDPPEIHKQLWERYKIEIPVLKWQDHCIARVSVQGYNSKAQMDYLIEALSELLGLGKYAEHKRQHG